MEDIFRPIDERHQKNTDNKLMVVLKTKNGNIIRLPISVWDKLAARDEYEVIDYE